MAHCKLDTARKLVAGMTAVDRKEAIASISKQYPVYARPDGMVRKDAALRLWNGCYVDRVTKH